MKRHVHDRSHEMIIVAAGQLQTVIGGQTLAAGPGGVLFYPAGHPHKEQAVGAAALETFFLNWDAASVKGPVSWPLQVQDGDGRIEFLARWIWDLWPPQSEAQHQLVQTLSSAAFLEYHRCATRHESQLTLRVKRYVQANLSRRVSLEELADHVGLSKFHFARVFARAAGEPPMRFVRRCRIEAARTLLLTTPLPLKAIAAQVGLADEYHLSRLFTKMAGLSPRAFRRGHKA